MALHVVYEGTEYTLDLEEMDLEEARQMEKHGVPNLMELEKGIASGDVDALTVAFWIMQRQNGQPGQRIDRVSFKPIRFVKALIAATSDDQPEPEGKDPEA